MLKIIAASIAGLLLLVVLIAAAAGGTGAHLGHAGSVPSDAALADIPSDYLQLYLRASTDCPGLDWSILAAIGKIESDHGRSALSGVHDGANSAGAQGPMQLLPAPFAVYSRPVPPGGTDPPSPYHPVNAIYAAARYLCASGARDGRDIPGAVLAYNHATSYVRLVLDQTARYATLLGPNSATGAASTAIAYARAQLGLPYIWGGDGPDAGEAGFDCSGLTHAAYAAADIQIPRTAHTQYLAGPLLPPGAPLTPGDLVFFGNPAVKITHVALYLGNGLIIHAPTFGQPVQIARLATMAPYTAASRPTVSPQAEPLRPR